MTDYCFRAPSLFNPTATPAKSGTVYHDALGAGERLARLKPCAQWLVDQMVARGVRAEGPETDEGGWMISIPAEDGFVLLVLDVDSGKDRPFQLFMSEIGTAGSEIAQAETALKAILETSPDISDLTIKG